MSSFTEMPPLRPMKDGKHWQITESLMYYAGELGSDTYVLVPQGSLTDFASVPQVLQNIFPPWGLYGPAAVVHDQLYSDQVMVVAGQIQPITRKRADDIFLEAMEVLGVPAWKRRTMYAGVRIGASGPWQEYRIRNLARLQKGDRWNE